MNRILILSLSILFSLSCFAQNDRPEVPITFVDVTWKSDKYQQLQKDWEVFLKKNKKDEQAWESYYQSAYYKFKTSRFCKDSIQLGSQEELKEIMVKMEKAIPDTYTYYKLMYKNGGQNHTNGHYLEKAYAIDPDNPSIYGLLIAYYDLTRDLDKKEIIYKKLIPHRETLVEDYKLTYGYNTLITCEKNAILIGQGDNHIYPTEYLIFAKGIRPDVTVINQSFFQIDFYYSAILKEYNIPEYTKTLDSFYKQFPENPREGYYAFCNDRIKHFISNLKDRPVYFPANFTKTITNAFKEDLYLIGITYKYSTTSFDNMAILKRNMEQKILLDILKVDLQGLSENSHSHVMNSVYLKPLSELFQHYYLSGEKGKSDQYKKLIYNIVDNYELLEPYRKGIEEFEKNESAKQ